MHDHLEIDDQLWERLKDLDPDILCRNCNIFYNFDDRYYTIPVLDEEYAVFPFDKKISEISDMNNRRVKPGVDLGLLLLHYLIGARDVPLKNERVSTKELTGGEMFFRGPHTPPVEKIIEKYGKNPSGLISAGEKLGGIKLDMGDASIELITVPKIPVTYVLWAQDDEFPASATILFDLSIQEFLPLDVIFGLSVFVYNRLIKV